MFFCPQAFSLRNMNNSKTNPKLSAEALKRGRMTISPRAKVTEEHTIPVEVLVSGIDTLNLAIDAIIASDAFFKLLDEHKEDAQKHKRKSLIKLQSESGQEER